LYEFKLNEQLQIFISYFFLQVYKVFSELTIISFLPWQCCLINSTPELNLNYKNQRTSLYGTSVGQNSQGSIAESSTPRSLSSHRMNVGLFNTQVYIMY